MFKGAKTVALLVATLPAHVGCSRPKNNHELKGGETDLVNTILVAFSTLTNKHS